IRRRSRPCWRSAWRPDSPRRTGRPPRGGAGPSSLPCGSSASMESDLVILLSILVLLMLSAFFSGSETAITGASRARIHTLDQQGDPRARQISTFWLRREEVIGALLV